jgi:hypothetical protein
MIVIAVLYMLVAESEIILKFARTKLPWSKMEINQKSGQTI